MLTIILSVLSSIRKGFRTRAALQAEILALRHQLLVLQRSSRGHKLRLNSADRVFWVWLSRLWTDWRSALIIVKPETVIVASTRLSTLLEMEEPPSRRPPVGIHRSPRPHPENEFDQSS